MPGLEKELGIFVHAVISGMIVYGTYTMIRIIRRIIRHNLLAVSIEDFLFWLGTSFYLFIQIYYTTDGRVRWYFVLGVAGGMILLVFLLFLMKKMTKKMFKKTKKTVETHVKKG